jgi:branched-chain amino acid transport system permease protein
VIATVVLASLSEGARLLRDNFWDYTVTGATIGAIYSLVALGYTLVYGVLRLINFAHSEIFMIGTFGALYATQWLGFDPGDPKKTGLALIAVLLFCLVIAMAASGASAVVLERIAYRPLRRRGSTRLAALISAIGASFAIAEAFALWRGRNFEEFPRLFDKTHKVFTLFGYQVRADQVLIILSALVMMVALDQFVRRTRLGRGVRAVAQNSETAQLMGVNIDRVIVLTFLLGGVMAGGAALLDMVFLEQTRYNIGFILGVKAFTAAVLGGIGNLRGALLGGFILGLVENYGSALFGTQWKDVISFTLLVAVLMFRPTGLLGESLGKARA